LKGRGAHGQRPELITRYGYDVKAASHMIRLMYEGIELLTTGQITYPRPEVDVLLEIRKGLWAQSRVEDNYCNLEYKLKMLIESPDCILPPFVDLEEISVIIAQAYLAHWQTHSFVERQ
jgi:hypothetical protein